MSKNPLRRLAEQVTLATMRPPLTPRLLPRSGAKPIDLAGKRVLLTGASSGIGECAAEQFARHGATVVAVARRQDLLDELVGRITENGGNATAIPCDLSDLDAVDALVADVEQRLGGVDILINNAGRSIRRPLAESLERWHDVERTMVLNYYSPLRLIRGIAPGNAAARRRAHHQRRDLGRVQRAVAAVRRLQRIEGRAVGSQPRDRNRMGDKGCALDHAVLPAGGHPDDRADQGVPGVAGADLRGGRGLDDHRGAHPAGPDRAADGAGRAGDGHLVVPGLATTMIRRQRLQSRTSPRVIDTTAWRFSPAGCCSGRWITSGR